MQQIERSTGLGGVERGRVEAVVETLVTLDSHGESLAVVAHEARNMVTALGLYCDLLEEPGVLSAPFAHYGNELRLVATASRRLVEKLVAIHSHRDSASPISIEIMRSWGGLSAQATAGVRQIRNWEPMPAQPINNLAGEILANRNLLAALAGSSIGLTVDVEGGALPVRLTGEDLTRVLVNLVKNAAEAMPTGGRIAISLHKFYAEAELPPWLMLKIEDNGPGIPGNALDKIFDSGYTSHLNGGSCNEGWPTIHRGLGLSITRSIIEAAGGRIYATNRTPTGACFEIELPVQSC